ncbi:cytochrome c oxidase assembly protein [Mangrovihabitans endophyticus]|uniref:Copper resistance protein D n=1 Tax=Mangrovihabitans endophyticus TaxID=1751298 RepID=A0A8J3FQP0_9ACTN|nr:cytochrome c oxidase assembly protein [Mangrovihabitans endophyticus]GGK99779.1 copper resistance protein D [Mangrovihabitans endophyticus]
MTRVLPATAAGSRRFWSLVAAAGAAGALAVVVVVSATAGDFPYAAFGTADPGLAVRVGTPVLRLAADAAATVCVGALVYAAFLTRPQPSGVIGAAAFAALRTAARAAAGWAVAALLLWPFDAAATVGLPVPDLLTGGRIVTATGALEGPKAWLCTAAVAGTLAVACARTLRWRATFGLVALGIAGTLPVVAAGHSASDANHDIATSAIAIHIPAAVVWLGTLIAVLRAHGPDRDPALRRYLRLSTGCFWVVTLSGLVDAAALAPGGRAFTTAYGGLLLLKAVLVAALGVTALRLRRRLRAGTVSPRRLLAVELGALAVAFGLAVGLTDLPAPKFLGEIVSGQQTLLGYDLTAPPTVPRLIADWRIEVLFAPLSLTLAALYLAGVRRAGQVRGPVGRWPGGRWPVGRLVAWLAGCAVLLLATSSGLARYAPAMFSLEAVTHMLVGMVAPLLLALGAPLLLAEAALPEAPADALPGAREWLAAVRSTTVIRLLTQPVVATVVFTGAPFLLYFTGLYGLTVRFHWAHLAMHLLFLAIGFLFAWTVAGPDPTPAPSPPLVRVTLLLVAMPLDIVFAVAILASGHVLGDGRASGNMYSALALPWVSDLAADQRLGAYLALAIGEAAMFAMLAVLVSRWRPAEPDRDYADLVSAWEQRRNG